MSTVDSDRELRIRRKFSAPKELVFQMWENPATLSKWWGPNGFSTTTIHHEFRDEGSWKYIMHGPDGVDYPNYIHFTSVAPGDHIRYEHGEDETRVLFTVNITFEDCGGGTEMDFCLTFPTAEELQKIKELYPAEDGLRQTTGRLSNYVTVLDAKQLQEAFEYSRSFAFPKELVWKVWSEKEHFEKWWGPKNAKMEFAEFDFIPGGKALYFMVTGQGDPIWALWRYTDIVRHDHIVFESSFSDAEGGLGKAPWFEHWPDYLLNIVDFVEEGGSTIVNIVGCPIDATPAQREQYKSMFNGMKGGFGGTFDQLEEYLNRLV